MFTISGFFQLPLILFCSRIKNRTAIMQHNRKEEVLKLILTAWANIIATVALIHNIRKDKKTAPHKQAKHMRKR